MSRVVRGFVFVVLVCLFIAIPATSAQTADPSPANPPPADDRPWPSPLLPATEPAEPIAPLAPRAATTPNLPWSRLVYYAFGRHQNWDLYYSDDVGSQIVRLTTSKAIEVEPDLNRGGTGVVYVSDEDGDFDLYFMRLSDQMRWRVLDTPANEGTPVWGPDGRIAFQSDKDGQPEIYVIRADGSGLTRLTNNPDFDGFPTWSPDGRLAFASRRNGQYRIWVMNADGSGQTQLSSQPGGLYPAWSPFGSQIAYSADANGDGWLDPWVMNADGTGQRQIRRSIPTVDTMPRSWAPDESHLALTEVTYDYFEQIGEWLIVRSALLRLYMGATPHMDITNAELFPFAPSWATLDTEAPVTKVAPLPAVSPHPFRVTWQAADRGPAGILRHEVQLSIDGGPWQMWLGNAPAGGADFTTGSGGHSYAFRSRAVDAALNAEPWPAAAEATTKVEALPPQTWLSPLPAFLRADRPFPLNRTGFDPGGSGIQKIEFEQRNNNAPWAANNAEWVESQIFIDPTKQDLEPGDTLSFRLRAIDNAHNVEPWTADPGDATTTLYRWSVTGRVTDNTGTSVSGAAVTTTPAALGAATTGPEGDYARYLIAGDPTTLDWAKPGYGNLPATTLPAPHDVRRDVALPPAVDAVLNGDFEAANWGAWQPGGTAAPTLSAAAANTGAQGVLLAPVGARFSQPHRLSNTDTVRETNARLNLQGSTPTVMWLSGADYVSQLLWSRREPDGTWTSPAALAQLSGGSYEVVVDDDGLLHVVLFAESGLIYLRQTSPTAWAAPEAVPSSTPAQHLQLIYGPDGALHLLWVENIPADSIVRLRYSRRAPGGGWSAPVAAVTLEGASLGNYGAALTPNGALLLGYLEWNFENAIGDRLWTRERRPDGQWTSPVLLQQSPDARLALDWNGNLTVGQDGRAHMLWTRSHRFPFHTRNDTYYAAHDGATWSAAQRIFIGANAVVLALGPDGAPHALLGRGDNFLYYTTLRDNVWVSPERMISSWASWPEMLIDGNGQPHVIYTARDEPTFIDKLQYIRGLSSGVWTEAQVISAAFVKNGGFDATLDAGGNVHVAWLAQTDDVWDTLPDVVYAGPPVAAAATTATLSQTVVVPTADHPVLSFFYGFGGATPETRLELVIGDDPPINLPTAGAEPGWAARHYWVDLSGHVGQSVAITFRLNQAANRPKAWAAVDDVSLGAAHGDVWVRGQGGSVSPGRTIAHNLMAGNRGGVAAGGATLTYTLPPELRFVSADPAPTTTNPLRWNLGTLSPGAAVTIRVTVAVDGAAKPSGTLVATAAGALTNELEMDNNTVEIITRVESRLFAPVVIGK